MRNTVQVTINQGTDIWPHVEEVRWHDGILVLSMDLEVASYPAHSVIKVVSFVEEEK
jgi:hypothetical protein